MLCEQCKKNQANTHVKSIINGEVTELSLCSGCAAKMGYGNVFDHMFDIGSMMSGFMGEPMVSALAPEKKCPGCGMSFAQISKGGRVGCAKCYDVFYDRLLPSIKRIHGNTIHTGKRLRKPQLASGETPVQNAAEEKIRALSDDLKTAVANQEFEKAAKLRDTINELKAQNGGV